MSPIVSFLFLLSVFNLDESKLKLTYELPSILQSPQAGISFVNGLVFASFKSAMEALRPEGGIEAPLKVFFAAGCISGAVSS